MIKIQTTNYYSHTTVSRTSPVQGGTMNVISFTTKRERDTWFHLLQNTTVKIFIDYKTWHVVYVIPQGCVKFVCSILSAKSNVNVTLMSSPRKLSPSPSPVPHSVTSLQISSSTFCFSFLITSTNLPMTKNCLLWNDKPSPVPHSVTSLQVYSFCFSFLITPTNLQMTKNCLLWNDKARAK
jgi:hypothetical protein